MTAVAPDFIEPLEAWRVWRVVEHRGLLALGSVVKSTVWPKGEPLSAECLRRRLLFLRRRRDEHDAPAETCDCGIYATTLDRVAQYLPLAALGRVVGRVALWGTVVECERGYRASHAYPLELYVPWEGQGARGADRGDVARSLAAYGVPVQFVDARVDELLRRLAELFECRDVVAP